MPRKHYSSEQIILKLREMEVLLGQDQTIVASRPRLRAMTMRSGQ